jgi:RNA polymerase sigma-32 factor
VRALASQPIRSTVARTRCPADESRARAVGITSALSSLAMNLPPQARSLDAYRTSLHGVKTLDPQDERDLARRWQAGDRAAGDRLIRASLPFVIAIALEYRQWGTPIEDLIQQGNLGLLKAAKKFDPERDCRLVTYAVYWIRAEIRDYVVRGYRVVRIGTTKGERRAMRAYRRTREEDVEKLAAVSGLPVAQVERLMPMLRARDTSLDATFDGEAPAIDRLADEGIGPEEELSRATLQSKARTAVADAIAQLPAREQTIVRERLLVDDPITLEALGVRLGISKERVRQLEERAKLRLQRNLAALHDAA